MCVVGQGPRVIAIESLSHGVLRVYGLGIYLGNKIPDVEPFRSRGLKNPCIQLDSGRIIWGFQCWWQEISQFERLYADEIQNIELTAFSEEH
jgi:hypothetical protein